MKELLLKNNILPDTLTKAQLENFEKFTKSANKKDCSEFEDFLVICEQRNRFVTQSLSSIRSDTHELITQAISNLESITPKTSDSVLLGFKRPENTEELVSRHQTLITNISWIIDKLSSIQYTCTKIISESDIELYIELKLRTVALSESKEQPELLGHFQTLSANSEYLDPQKVKDTLINHASTVEHAIENLKKLCIDTDLALDSTKANNASLALYDRTARSYMSILHDILLTIS